MDEVVDCAASGRGGRDLPRPARVVRLSSVVCGAQTAVLIGSAHVPPDDCAGMVEHPT